MNIISYQELQETSLEDLKQSVISAKVEEALQEFNSTALASKLAEEGFATLYLDISDISTEMATDVFTTVRERLGEAGYTSVEKSNNWGNSYAGLLTIEVQI